MSTTVIRHGLSIGIERVNDNVFISMKAVGKLSHADYEKINPMIDSALEGIDEPRARVFLDASELEGWEARAAWDDFKLGLKHGNEFEKIAIFGNKKWHELAAKVTNWFLSGEVKFFDDADAAWVWLQE